LRVFAFIDMNRNDLSNGDATNSYNVDKTFDLRRLRNTHSGEVGYFVVNQSLKYLAINGTAVSPQIVAGPLPDFAVVSIEDTALLWFGSWQAMNGYLPEQKVGNGTKRKRDDATSTVPWDTILHD